MKSLLFVLSIFAINSLDCFFIEFEYKCDFSFGDPSWNYSEVVYDRHFYLEPEQQYFRAHLPKHPGKMVSYVCVELDGTPKENAIVDYTALFHYVTVNLTRPEYDDVKVHILAKHHGY